MIRLRDVELFEQLLGASKANEFPTQLGTETQRSRRLRRQ